MTGEETGETRQGLPVLAFADAPAFEAWLAKHHANAKGLWLRIAKKANASSSLTHAQALEIALCQGWIDGQKAPLDERFWLQRFVPRGPRSVWSQLNREKALKLIEANRMRPAGLAAVEAARRDGRWERAYAPMRSAAVPEDLEAALAHHPAAAAFFASLDRHNRFAILYRLASAKKAETRERRLEKFIGMLNRKEKIYP